jgi:nicotinamidase-related amidase
MSRPRFSLTSDQLELLLAFEESEGLGRLAETIGRDPSVVSRSLQRIAEEHPVLLKVRGRWELTPLGSQINNLTRSTLATYQQLLPKNTTKQKTKINISPKSVLVIINAQIGLLDSTQEGRNNSDAERNIAKLLTFWRKKNGPVIHVKHVSENPQSMFFRTASGCDFLPSLNPIDNEDIIEKTKSSAFAETILEARLREIEADNIMLVGFTANECIDAAAKDAASLGFTPIVIGDATAMFDIRDPHGKLIKAERIHKLTLANINAYYAKVIRTEDVI